MAYACPMESDPRDKLQQFVTDPGLNIITGLRTDGLMALVEMVESTIRKEEPDAKVVVLDREVLSDNRIDMPRELRSYFDRMTSDGTKVRFLMSDELPVVNWQSAVQVMKGRNAQVYCFSVACRQIPTCSKLL